MVAGIGSEKAITHDKLPRYLKSSSDESVRKLGESVAALCCNRRDADYDMKVTITVDDAQLAIEDAEAFLQDLAVADTRGEIGSAVESYIRQTHSGGGR